MTDFDVVINGGGPVGMGLAIELGQRGVKTCVVERHREPQQIPKGQNLTQRTGEHFRAWGCEAEMRAAHRLPADAGIGGMTMYKTLLSEYSHEWFNRGRVGSVLRRPEPENPAVQDRSRAEGARRQHSRPVHSLWLVRGNVRAE